MAQIDDRVLAEIKSQPTEATLNQVAGRWVLTMTRNLRHPPEQVWSYLTEPRLLMKWSPVVPNRTLDSAGPAISREAPGQEPVDADVLVCDPPRELVHRWGAHILRWTLTSTGTGSRLTMEHTFNEPAEASMYAAGWHLCLAVLGLDIDGNAVERVVGQRALDYGWSELKGRYEEPLRGQIEPRRSSATTSSA